MPGGNVARRALLRGALLYGILPCAALLCGGAFIATISSCLDSNTQSCGDGHCPVDAQCEEFPVGEFACVVERCGDGEKNGFEICDGNQVQLDCVDLDFDFGGQRCNSSCDIDLDLTRCSNLVSQRSSGQFNNIFAVWGSGPDNAIAVTDRLSPNDVPILRYDGNAWTAEGSPATFTIYDLYGVWGTGEDDIFAGGGPSRERGQILYWDGRDWTEMALSADGGDPADTFGFVSNIWSHGPTEDVFAVTRVGEVLRYQRNGGSWQRDTQLDTGALEGVWGSSSEDVYAVGSELIAHYDGQTWSSVPEESVEGGWDGTYFTDVWGTDSANVFAVGSYFFVEDDVGFRFGIALQFDGERWRCRSPIHR